jgi:hypothetical protein
MLIDRERCDPVGGQQKSRAVGITNSEIDPVMAPGKVGIKLEEHFKPLPWE